MPHARAHTSCTREYLMHACLMHAMRERRQRQRDERRERQRERRERDKRRVRQTSARERDECSDLVEWDVIVCGREVEMVIGNELRL